MIGHLVIQPQPTEPAARQVEVHLQAKTSFGADAHHIANHQHPQDELWINRREAYAAVERLQLLPHVTYVEEPVDLSQYVIRRQMGAQIEFVKQLRFDRLIFDQRSVLYISIN